MPKPDTNALAVEILRALTDLDRAFLRACGSPLAGTVDEAIAFIASHDSRDGSVVSVMPTKAGMALLFATMPSFGGARIAVLWLIYPGITHHYTDVGDLKAVEEVLFERLPVRKVELDIVADHPSRLDAFAEAGWLLEARYSSDAFFRGRYLDRLQFARFRDAYLERPDRTEYRSV